MKGLVTVGKSGSGNEVMGMGTLITKKKKKLREWKQLPHLNQTTEK